MKIKQIILYKLQIPLIRPFITALRRTEHVEDIVIKIETECGYFGFGAAASTPVITGDSQDAIIGALSLIAAKLVGKDLSNFEELLLLNNGTLVNNTSAKAAIDMALHDVFTRILRIPLYKFLGGGAPRVKILTTVSVKDVAAMVEDACLFVRDGFETLKIKVGLNPLEDIERLHAIRAAVGPGINILSDANQGWDAKSALQIIDSLQQHKLGIAMVEQPVKAWDLANLKFVRDNSRIPIYADEAVFSLRDAAKVISGQIADGINIKLMKSGGIYAARPIYDLATSHNIPCMAGCMLESPIGLTAMASFVVGRSNIKFVDLDPITMIQTNPVHGGVRLAGANLLLSDEPGLGINQVDGLQTLISIQ